MNGMPDPSFVGPFGFTDPKNVKDDEVGKEQPKGLEAKIGDLVLWTKENGELLAGYLMDKDGPYIHEFRLTLSHQRYGARNESTHLTRGDRSFRHSIDDHLRATVIEEDSLKQVGQKTPQLTQYHGVIEVVEFSDEDKEGDKPKVGDLLVLETSDGERIAGFFKGREKGGWFDFREKCYRVSYQRYGHNNLSSSSNIGDRKYKPSKIAKVYVVNFAAMLTD